MGVADAPVISGAMAGNPLVRAVKLEARAGGIAPGTHGIPRISRLLVLAAASLLLGVFAFPLWNVRLTAPQYPEGLGMHIRINNVEGATVNDLDNINNLNHYIGMKRIEADAIPELVVMPWIVAALIGTGLVAAALGRRRVLYAWTVGFLVVAIAGLVDFWRWEYDYGHNLDFEHAVLKIPGMSYQPPLIGTKQLLNFRAGSWPAAGGILAMLALVLALAAVFFAWRSRKLAPVGS